MRVFRYAILTLFISGSAFSQSTAGPAGQDSSETGTSNDLFVMFGSDLVRPGWLPRATYNIGLGHTFGSA